MLRIGLPAALQMLATALAEIVLLGLVNRRGSSATADYGAATQILSWVQLPAMRLGIAAAIFSGHAVGAGRRVELPVAVVLEAGFGLAGVFRACPAAFLDMLVLHGLYYRYKEKKDG